MTGAAAYVPTPIGCGHIMRGATRIGLGNGTDGAQPLTLVVIDIEPVLVWIFPSTPFRV